MEYKLTGPAKKAISEFDDLLESLMEKQNSAKTNEETEEAKDKIRKAIEIINEIQKEC